jgi:imidazoleglycerol-phosphate dehydratase
LTKRPVTVERTTRETQISLKLDLSTPEEIELEIGPPFFKHLLHALCYHGSFSLAVTGKGDLEVDPHHLVEDTGLVLGEALKKTVDTYGAVERYGYSVVPMDDALSEVAIDVCGRPYLAFAADFPQPYIAGFDCALIREFFAALAGRASINLHTSCRYGQNSHHMAESLFKAAGRAIIQAYTPVAEQDRVRSTKGTL